MRSLIIACTMSSFALPALAFSPQEPVQTLMNATVENWSGANEEFQFVLDEKLLNSVYSKGFAKAYRDAKKKLTDDANDGENYEPFGYDIITNSQDGCALQDVKSDVSQTEGKKAEVTVSFKHYGCMGDAPSYQIRNTVYFDVIEEDGKAVVDNIRHKTDEGEQSLRKDLVDILKGQ